MAVMDNLDSAIGLRHPCPNGLHWSTPSHLEGRPAQRNLGIASEWEAELGTKSGSSHPHAEVLTQSDSVFGDRAFVDAMRVK